MKRKLMVSLVIAVVMGTGVYFSQKPKTFVDFVLNEVEALARYELPEVEIVCGKDEHKGRCWDGDCEPFYTPFGFAKAWDCYQATGDPQDVCIQDAPCL